jgi:hypothetical protein
MTDEIEGVDSKQIAHPDTKSTYNDFFNNLNDEYQRNSLEDEPTEEEVEDYAQIFNEDEDGEDYESEEREGNNSSKPKKKRLSQSERQKKIIQDLKNELAEKEKIIENATTQNSSLEVELFNKLYNEIERDEEYWTQIQDGCNAGIAEAMEDGESTSFASFNSKLQDSKIALDKLKQKKQDMQKLYKQYTATKNNSINTRSTASKNPDLDDFLERNPFLDVTNSTNYSPSAAAKVNELSSQLTQEYKMNGRGDEVQSEGYFRELEEIMKENLNTNQRPQSKSVNRSTPNRSSRMVAPVGKRETFSTPSSPNKFSLEQQKQMLAYRNIFGPEYDDLLIDAFSKAKRSR